MSYNAHPTSNYHLGEHEMVMPHNELHVTHLGHNATSRYPEHVPTASRQGLPEPSVMCSQNFNSHIFSTDDVSNVVGPSQSTFINSVEHSEAMIDRGSLQAPSYFTPRDPCWLTDPCVDPFLGDSASTIARGSQGYSDDAHNQGGPPISNIPWPLEHKGRLRLACPFWKSNPREFEKCRSYEMTKPWDVVQHIWRVHVKPEHQCPNCFKEWRGEKQYHQVREAEFRDHINRGGCVRPQILPEDPRMEYDDFMEITDGVAAKKKSEKTRGARRGISDIEEWFMLWDKLFPRQARPQSAFLYSFPDTVRGCIQKILSEEVFFTLFGPEGNGVRRILLSYLTSHFGDHSPPGPIGTTPYRPSASNDRVSGLHESPQRPVVADAPTGRPGPNAATPTWGSNPTPIPGLADHQNNYPLVGPSQYQLPPSTAHLGGMVFVSMASQSTGTSSTHVPGLGPGTLGSMAYRLG